MDYKTLLNEEQFKPVVDTEGAVLVLAGAGSGKTRVLTHRIAYLIGEKNVNPYNILAITFTNKAAGEMKSRIHDITGYSDMWISTFHSFCARVLRNDIEKLDMGYNTHFTIYSESDSSKIVTRIVKELGLEENGNVKKNARWHISNAKNGGKSPAEYRKLMNFDMNAEYIEQIYSRYEEILQKNNALDFDDLLLKTIILFKDHADVLRKYQDRFRYIHIDEFQDTNKIQYILIKMLAKLHGNLFVVGDDDQSIYGWRGADIRNILEFKESYPDCKIYRLEQNYRSTGNILNLANKIIDHNKSRTGKVLWTEAPEGAKVDYRCLQDETSEADFVLGRIEYLIQQEGYKHSDFAILVRINSITREFEERLRLHSIPYKLVGGFKFFERKEIKDYLAYMSIIINPNDNENIMRVINVPKRGFGATAQAKFTFACNQEGISYFDGVMNFEKLDLPTAAKRGLSEFRDCLLDLIAIKHFSIDEFAQNSKDIINFNREYDSKSEEDLNKLDNIDELIASMVKYKNDNPEANIETYMQSVSLISDTDVLDDDNYVTIATVHGVKGLEYKTVFIVGLEDKLFPLIRDNTTDKDIEEERRIMYVAVTRARERLYLTSAKSRYRFGQREWNVISRFIQEGELIKKSNTEPTYAPKVDLSNYMTDKSNDMFGMSKLETPKTIENYNEFKVNTKVRHARYGVGVITEITGENGKISFPQLGVKMFNLRLAKLEIVNND